MSLMILMMMTGKDITIFQDKQVDPSSKTIIMFMNVLLIMMTMKIVMTMIILKEEDITTVSTQRLGT